MSIRSDVGLALKASTVEMLEGQYLRVYQWLCGDAVEHAFRLEGELFIFEHVKWGNGHPNVDALYEILRGYSDEDYLVVEACSEYPSEESEYDAGGWLDNPWRLRKELIVRVLYE